MDNTCFYLLQNDDDDYNEDEDGDYNPAQV
jgi:hypothetical protein